MSYGGEEDRRVFAVTINWVFTFISLCAVTVRFLSRRLLERGNWEIDDGMVAFAMVVILVRTIWLTANVSMGFGLHLKLLLQQDPALTMKLARSSYGLTALSLWTWLLPKLPVVALLVRLFRTYNRQLSRNLWSSLGFLLLWNSIMTVVTFVKCSPVQKNWQPALAGTCWDARIYLYMGYFSGAYSAGLDFVYAIYPMIRTSQLQMEKSRKVLIASAFSLGIPAGIVSIYKTTTIVSLINEKDPTFATVPLEAWNCVESTALMLAATVPMSKPIMVLTFHRIKSLTSYISGWSSSGSRAVSKASKANSTPSVSAIHNLSRQGYKKQGSKEEILLEEVQQPIARH